MIRDSSAVARPTPSPAHPVRPAEAKLARIFTPSRLFIYYNERAIEHSVDSDSGAQIRDGIKSVAKQGDCPETEWPYVDRQIQNQAADEMLRGRAEIQGRFVSAPDAGAEPAQGLPRVRATCLSLVSRFMKALRARRWRRPATRRCRNPARRRWAATRRRRRLRRREAVVHRAQFVGAAWGMAGYFTLPYAYLTDENLASDFWTIRVVQ